METNKTILLREVVSVKDRKTIGSITDLCVDAESASISHYVIGDIKAVEHKVLPREKVIAIGDTFATIQSESALLSSDSKAVKKLLEEGFRLVGTPVFSSGGNRLGAVTGFKFNSETGAIQEVSMGDKVSFSSDEIMFISPEYVFVNSQKMVDVSTIKDIPDNSHICQSMNDSDAPDLSTEQSVSNGKPDENLVLRELLLGAKVNQRVESKDSEFSIDEGEAITPEVLDKAQKHDALLLLTIHVDM